MIDLGTRGAKGIGVFLLRSKEKKSPLKRKQCPNPKHIITIPNFLGDGPGLIMFAAKVAIFATHVPALWGFVTFL